MSFRLIRVFPRKTRATPDNALAWFGPPDRLAEADEVHVSVALTYDKPWAEHLAEKWRHVAPVKIGGVAYGDRDEEFVPGRYIKPGYVFTSRGCPRRCWFCSVWKRDPVPRLLPITDGWNILETTSLLVPAITSRPSSPCCVRKTVASNSPEAWRRSRSRTTRLIYWRACGRTRRCSSPMIRGAISRRCTRRRADSCLRRLRKDRPDIHARVLAGELSPHAGMIEAGFRKKPEVQ